MTKRTIVQRVFITIGVAGLLLFVVSGLNNSTASVMGGLFLFIGGTNFFSQCPLLSAAARIFNRKHWNTIRTQTL